MFPLLANAQPSTQSVDTISLTQSPLFPELNEPVDVSVISRIININNKQTVWRVNGDVVASGVGIREITVNTTNRDNTIRVDYNVTVYGRNVQRTLEIKPTDVNLIWEAKESFVPPFYKGKALHPGWGSVKITALSHIYREDGRMYSPNELLYTWEYNGLVHGSDSGRGRDSFVINTVPRRGNAVRVQIETINGSIVADKSIRLPITDPDVLLYSHNQLTGPFVNQAVNGSYSLSTNEEIELIAYPYFFLVSDSTDPSLSYDWSMNNDTLEPTDRDNIVRLRRQPGVRGQAQIDVDITDNTRIFPSTSAKVNIAF